MMIENTRQSDKAERAVSLMKVDENKGETSLSNLLKESKGTPEDMSQALNLYQAPEDLIADEDPLIMDDGSKTHSEHSPTKAIEYTQKDQSLGEEHSELRDSKDGHLMSKFTIKSSQKDLRAGESYVSEDEYRKLWLANQNFKENQERAEVTIKHLKNKIEHFNK